MSLDLHQELSPSGAALDDGSISGSLLATDVETGTSEDIPMIENSVGREVTGSEEYAGLEPYVGMEFKSEQEAGIFYNEYSSHKGFSIRKDSLKRSMRDQSVTARLFVCSKEGFRRATTDVNKEGNVKRRKAVTRVGCKAHMWVKRKSPGLWVVRSFERDHNHELITLEKLHFLRSRRNIYFTTKEYTKKAGKGASTHQSLLTEEARGTASAGSVDEDSEDCVTGRRRKLGSDSQIVSDYLKRKQDDNRNFYYAIQLDHEQSLRSAFWVEARSRMAYSYFDDVVSFDLTYEINEYGIPFATFTGVNHHQQTVLFGSALLADESTPTLVWLFQTWLTAMCGRHPKVIITDQHVGIESAISQVFLTAHHCYCKWQILNKASEKFKHVIQAHNTFNGEFQRCIDSAETTEDFESRWYSFLDNYELKENKWLQSVYKVRHKWVPVFLQNTFFARMTTTPRSETKCPFFDWCVSPKTKLQDFITHYEKALAIRYEKEAEEDYRSIYSIPVLKSSTTMEKQASAVYTRKMFLKFQEELFEAFEHVVTKIEEDGPVKVYKVARFGAEEKKYKVVLNASEMRANCSCQMFEFLGMPCRHALIVLRQANILMLPSHYILKRWTRNAKDWIVLDDHGEGMQGDCPDSLTLRYQNLCQEAMKYADVAAVCKEVYHVAMDVLRQGLKKVVNVAKDYETRTHLGSPVRGCCQGDSDCTNRGMDAAR
ncbi:hypothetical protein HHK36_002149 [Tetracentron sinense]|uniref:Protein FAR1-RELATED SEQUENCE n=1 Tax=Tetracentron sinense TaxID=13715 RepID=A0A834ZYJ1_TETSI|nr:hypothetical protein HHK36_002149 [Tetracentron sinense]